MSLLASELCKALFAIAIFASFCGLGRLALAHSLGRALKLALGGFIVFMLLPLTYLYLRLALPAAADRLLPFQAMAIWLYGPALLVLLHIVLHRPVLGWQAVLYGFPPAIAIVRGAAVEAGDLALPAGWELVSLGQALLFALAACAWTVRCRGQLRVLAGAFPGSSFGALLYLCVGLLALLAADFYVHWQVYVGRPLPLWTFYAWVTPGALYSLGVSLWLVWSVGSRGDAAVGAIDSAPAVDDPPRVPRQRELSESAARSLIAQLENLMREKQLYARNDLSLSDLAAELRISTHLTSELLNVHLGVSFYQLLNRHRVDAAAALLRAGNGQCRLIDVAYEAGFNNPNTFHREFKRAHGVTPAEFRRASRDVAAAVPSGRTLSRPT